MEPSLFSFIWKYSRKQQLALLALTLVSFPFLYASLELPKRIINDAIGAELNRITVWGVELTQIQYLFALCLAFLAMVLISGLMKMKLNTMKGVLSERMLRRLRYMLIGRMMRFPRSYYQTTSQGELVSMITSEAEPMGGLMGDAIAQPVFQAGQMLTIVTFLFMQNVWFGLASVALIPLQAWIIPKLQRQINLLNKARIQEVRRLSSEIGETAAGISDLRANGGWRYRLAQVTDRLGRLYDIRFRIYQKKFFMKFLNNLISQMTPFLFYSVGGYLAIQGQITVGALVAALAAYKDLSSPWKELLDYYNQVQDMSLRWQVVTERFAPLNMIEAELFEGEPETIPRLDGPVELRDVTVRDQDGNTILEDINLIIPPGARVAVQSDRPAERAALAQLLTREILPARGQVLLSGHPINELHQSVIAARIGHAHSRPYLFDGTLGDNLMMPLRVRPKHGDAYAMRPTSRQIEALQAGNSGDGLDADWIDPSLAGLEDVDQIRDWWFQLVEAMGTDEFMFRRTLRSMIDVRAHGALADEIVALRDTVAHRLAERGLADLVYRFDPDRFNPAVPLGGNLLYAAPARKISQDQLVSDGRFIQMLYEEGLADEAMSMALGVVATLRQTFGRDGTQHPLFRKLGLEDETYLHLLDIADRHAARGAQALGTDDRALLMTVPFLLTAEQIGPAFPEEYKEKILAIRRTRADRLRGLVGSDFVAVDPSTYIPRLTVLENALFGRVSIMAGARAEEIEDTVAEIMNEAGLRRKLAAIIYDLPAGLGGANLPTVFQERAAFSRAAIKRPDILVLDKVLASHDSESRLRTRQKLRDLLPDAIILFLEDRFAHPEAYDLFIDIRHGRIDGVSDVHPDMGETAGVDLDRKLKIIAATPLFARLDTRNQRLLAFSAQWYDVSAGQVIFSHGQTADAAYLCLEGRAALRWPDDAPGERPITLVGPGRLIGDLSIITRQPRPMDLISETDSKFLRIGAEEFRAVIEHDATVSLQLLQTVSGHLVEAGDILRAARLNITDFTDPNMKTGLPDARGVSPDA
ncbi:ABC transporter transmembrane domain-containing protein [Ruegeria sp. WL0004]|uniref:ABC transporter transmembrane domain-containing protein n=1 Tax=Ruegeria marisflavi TaxID=2984152 RepID=A0ABT2WKK2_9RHOB|nr:ABC transporter transmembrane domain-containing protein [Ruegeria sp. WL0004]MCU9836433.1 ABC transporter transmembrane domain-containing protein [Ruegeria sp. WL0004]